jgi:pimeloyl-ACP methyl ester carboxylesterase
MSHPAVGASMTMWHDRRVFAQTIDGVDIHYEVTGTGPAVLLAHGVADSSADWGEIPERLADDHTVVNVDLRGHGRSGLADDYSALVMIQDVVAVLTATEVESPLFVGHALGAVVLSAAAAQLPCRGVINIDQPLRFDEMVAVLKGVENELRTGDSMAAMTHVFDELDGGLTPEPLRSSLLANRKAIHRDVALGVWDIAMKSTAEEINAMTGVVGNRVTAPYLAIHGTDQGDGYEEWLVERLPTAVVEWWDRAGHYLHLTHTDRFLNRLVEFEAEIA